MTSIKKNIVLNEEKIQQNLSSGYMTINHQDREVQERNIKIRDDLFSEMLRLMWNKRYYMLGPEKGKNAKFIAENYEEIFQILNKKVE